MEEMKPASSLTSDPGNDRHTSLQRGKSNTPGSQSSTPSARKYVAADGHAKDEYKDLRTFERKLAVVGWLALGAAGLHNLTWFLGFCALTWATVLLLGGLISFLEKRDFYLVSILLLLEACRFVEAVFFSHLVTRSLETFTFARRRFDWVRKSLLVFLRIIAPAGQMLFVSPSIAFPMFALRSVHYQTGTSPFDSIDASLYIFYHLVVINASIASIALLYSLLVSLALMYWYECESLQRYYDEVVWRGAHKGLLLAEVDILVCAFEVQAQEYFRGMYPKTVQHKYKDLIGYLLNNPRGIEAACISLESNDPYQQQAAAHIVGLWATNDKYKKLRFETQLLSKLADKLTLGKTGWAAANSFKSLGDQDREVVFKVKNQRGKKVVDILMDYIDPENSLTMMCVQAMLPLVQNLRQQNVKVKKISALNDKLRRIIGSDGFWVGQRITAGFALHLQKELTEADIDILRGMEAEKGEYCWKVEKEYLTEMLGEVPVGCAGMRVIDDHNVEKHRFFNVVFVLVFVVWLSVGAVVLFLTRFTIHKLNS